MADIAAKLRSITKESFTSELDRQLAVAEACALVYRIESPWETGFRQAWIDPTRMASLEIANKLDLWTKWVADGGEPKSLDEIAKLVTCDYQLLSRVICHLAGSHLLDVVQPGIFGLTPFTDSLGRGTGMPSTVSLYFDIQGPVLLNLPKYVESINFQNPNDPTNDAFTSWAKIPV